MANAGPEALAQLQELIRQMRAIPQVREKQPGTFHLLGQLFAQFRDDDGKLTADLRKASGSGLDRLPIATSPDQRKFIDEAKRRATKIIDE
jgi:hypothetical protein